MKNIIKHISALVFSLMMAACFSVTAFASSVTVDANRKIDFGAGSTYASTDIFTSFKSVMPGDLRTETITISNNSDFDYIRVYLRAILHDGSNSISDSVLEEIQSDDRWVEENEQNGTTELDYMNDFLSQLNLTVKNGDTVIFDAAPNTLGSSDSTDSEASDAGTLAENLYLGTLAKEKTTTLTATLSVPITLGNEYSNRIGEVTWAFVVEGFHAPTISISPASVTIYQGGNGGYDAVVGGNGEIVSSNSLPTPLFYISDPDVDDDSVGPEDLIFISDHLLDDSSPDNPEYKSWSVEKAGNDSEGVPLYYIIPVYEGRQNPVRVEYFNGDESYTNDNFDVSAVDELYADCSIRLYTDTTDTGTVTAYVKGFEDIPCKIDSSNTATLRVRALEDWDGSIASNPVFTVGTPTEELEPETAAVDGNGSSFTLNDTSVPVEDSSKVGLLFDDIIDEDANRTEALLRNTDDQLGEVPDGYTRHYQAKYLDLIDTMNGNAWVTASNNVTVYWAYPEGTDQNTNFELTHFRDLHRDNSEGDNSGYSINEIDASEKENIPITKGEYGITFEVSPAGFSPFVLTWSTVDPGNLSVTKTVSGTAGDKSSSFNFEVSLSDKTINGQFGDMIFTDGIASFQLKHKETILAEGLPAGVQYVVTELDQNKNGYSTTSVGTEGVIESDKTAGAAFVNHKDQPGNTSTPPTPESTIPQTGDTSNPLLLFGIMIACAFGMIVIFVLKKRHSNP